MSRSMTALVLAASLLATPALAEDVIRTDIGHTLRGQIVEENEKWVGIDVAGRVVWVERSEIAEITRDKKRSDRPAPQRSEASAGTEDEAGEHVLTVNVELVVKLLRSDKREERVEAIEFVNEAWPQSRPVVEAGLRDKQELVRLECVRILDNEKMKRTEGLIAHALNDTSPRVRVAALRVVRHRKMAGLEHKVISMMRGDGKPAVQNEAIRTLEDIGTRDCLSHVLSAFGRAEDKNERRRYRRVLKALFQEDLGDDFEAWRDAEADLFADRRKLRGEK